MEAEVFAGLDDVGWDRLRHAYGPATEVPDILRGLVSDDAAVREVALDHFQGAVHHQGSIYDSTVACIPFLLAAATTAGLPGRGAILELLAAIGDAASGAVAAARLSVLALLADDDPDVRGGAASLLAADPAALTSLLDRLAVEQDLDVRIAIVRALGSLSQRLPSEVDREAIAAAVLGAVDVLPPRAGVVALAEAVRVAAAPDDVVARLGDLLAAAYAEDVPPPSPEPITDTLRGYLREQLLAETAGRPSPHLYGVTRDTCWAFGDRVDDRIALLTAQLRAPGWAQRGDALLAVMDLTRGWRGDYRALAVLVGEQLAVARSEETAANVLAHLGELAAPAADALAGCLDAMPRETQDRDRHAWLHMWPGGGSEASPVLTALTWIGDRRALPALRWLVEHDRMPDRLGHDIARLGPAAVELLPSIRARLRSGPDAGLLKAVAAMGSAAAPAVPDLLALEPTDAMLDTLGHIGPAAAAAGPAVRALTERTGGTAAVLATWRIERDPEPALRALGPMLDADDREAVVSAATALAELGPAATKVAAGLRAALDSDDEWQRHHAARAWWRVTADPVPVVPVLAELWHAQGHHRPMIAGCLAEIDAVAGPAEPLLRAALATSRRLGVTEIGEIADIFGCADISVDEAFVRDCRTALNEPQAS